AINYYYTTSRILPAKLTPKRNAGILTCMRQYKAFDNFVYSPKLSTYMACPKILLCSRYRYSVFTLQEQCICAEVNLSTPILPFQCEIVIAIGRGITGSGKSGCPEAA